MLCFLAICLLLQVLDVSGDSPLDPHPQVQVIPLVPHRVQKERHRRLFNASWPTVDRPTRYPRRRRLADDDEDEYPLDPQQVAALFQGYGTHYADLWCGSPTPQRQTVIVDTGSGVTAFPCSQCQSPCGVPEYHVDALFDESASQSFIRVPCGECLRGHCGSNKKNGCAISNAYAEGSSWQAYLARDTCYIGGLHDRYVHEGEGTTDDLDPLHAADFGFPFQFGCQTRITGLFVQQLADGIMGMEDDHSSFWEQMYNAGKIPRRAFSLCFSRHDSVDESGTEAGAMTMGGMDPRLHRSDVVMAAVNSEGGFYSVYVRKIYLREGGGGDSALSSDSTKQIVTLDLPEANLNGGKKHGIIVDSGTTDSYFPRSIKDEFVKVYRQVTGKVYGHSAQKLTRAEVDQLPTILFQLAGDEDFNGALVTNNPDRPIVGLVGDLDSEHPLDVLLAMPPSHYMEYNEDTGAYKARFYLDEGSGGVIGANAMQGHDVLFDIDNDLMGWAESDCDYTTLVKDFYGITYPPHPAPTTPSRDTSPASSPPTSSPVSATICSSQTCEGSLLFLAIGLVILGAAFFFKNDRPPSYPVSPELELQTVDSGDDDFNTQYRDRPVEESAYEDDVEENEGTFT